MKKIIALTLILAALASLAACGGSAPPPLPAAGQTDPASGAVASDAAASAEEAPAPETAPAEPEPTPAPARKVRQVEITADNFFDYFEFVEFPAGELEKHLHPEDGSTTAIIARSAFYLKEGFEIAPEKAEECTLQAHVRYMRNAYNYVDRAVKVNLKDCSYEILRNLPDQLASLSHDEQITGSYEDGKYFVYIGSDTVLFATTVKIIEDMKLLSASGTLYLYE